MALQDVYDYFRSYDKSTYEVVACQGNEPTEEDVAAFEKKYKMKLPEEFREFTMSPLGGLFMEVREEVWPRGKQFDIGPFWSFLRGIIVYGIANNIPDFLSLDVRTNQLHKEGFKGYIPFLQLIGNGDEVYCFDSNGNVVLLHYYESDEAEFIGGTFSECLMKQIEELEERKNRKLQQMDG